MESTFNSSRVTVDGKFFRCGAQKFYCKGVTYGPFAPNAEEEMFASKEQTAKDFAQLRELGANLIRVYYVPPRWLMDLASEYQLKILVDIPWPKHLCFLDSAESREESRTTVRKTVESCKGHPAVFAYSVVNEIPADIVRWSGANEVAEFIDELITVAKGVDPECLCTFTSFPPTEFLRSQNVDFHCFNVYLHQQKSFESYLARLQSLAAEKPLMLGEFGLDSIREGEEHKCEVLAWQIETAFRAGLAGMVVFSFTDDWFRGGNQIEDWAFGLTTRDRQPKKSFALVQKMFAMAPYFPLVRCPKVSVVVASYNGGSTLKTCLDSLRSLNYPDYEVILVDDGSTDQTPTIVKNYPQVRYIAQPNCGLSVARNTGINAAVGEIVAFTDSDCRADEDWLFYAVSDLLSSGFTAIGGHNFLPPDDSPVAASVMASPGGPAHVMLTDREAEHVPGCNMLFFKWALDEIGGFDAIFRKAGDDVDVCWRLQERDHKIGFSHAGFVWHYRRSTVKAYLKQQAGYGEAEALLSRKHPEYFNSLGGGIWRGKIYSPSKFGITIERPIIYHGLFGSGFFQKLYAPQPSFALMIFTSLEYQCAVTLPLLVLSNYFESFLIVALLSILFSSTICIVAAAQAEIPARQRRRWSRPLVAVLFFLQPIVRGWARYKSRLNLSSKKTSRKKKSAAIDLFPETVERFYWSRKGVDRYQFLNRIFSNLGREDWQNKPDSGWDKHDAEIFDSNWSRLRFTTVGEDLGHNKLFLRCRIKSNWSFLAKIIFWVLLAAEIVTTPVIAQEYAWAWMILFTIPMLVWWLQCEKWEQEQLFVNLLDGTAAELGLEKYIYHKTASATKSKNEPPISPQSGVPELAQISG